MISKNHILTFPTLSIFTLLELKIDVRNIEYISWLHNNCVVKSYKMQSHAMRCNLIRCKLKTNEFSFRNQYQNLVLVLSMEAAVTKVYLFVEAILGLVVEDVKP